VSVGPRKKALPRKRRCRLGEVRTELVTDDETAHLSRQKTARFDAKNSDEKNGSALSPRFTLGLDCRCGCRCCFFADDFALHSQQVLSRKTDQIECEEITQSRATRRQCFLSGPGAKRAKLFPIDKRRSQNCNKLARSNPPECNAFAEPLRLEVPKVLPSRLSAMAAKFAFFH